MDSGKIRYSYFEQIPENRNVKNVLWSIILDAYRFENMSFIYDDMFNSVSIRTTKNNWTVACNVTLEFYIDASQNEIDYIYKEMLWKLERQTNGNLDTNDNQ